MKIGPVESELGWHRKASKQSSLLKTSASQVMEFRHVLRIGSSQLGDGSNVVAVRGGYCASDMIDEPSVYMPL